MNRHKDVILLLYYCVCDAFFVIENVLFVADLIFSVVSCADQ